jgi:symplekin
MAQASSSPSEILPQLEAARKLVLGDAHFYTQIVPGIAPIIGPTAAVEVRRWGAEFLAETFATPALADAQKEEICLDVVAFIRGVLESPTEDALVVKSVIQAVASFYTLLFRAMYVSEPSSRALCIIHFAHEHYNMIAGLYLAISDFMCIYSITRPDDFFSKKAISSKANAWQMMTAIKSSILKRMDSSPSSVRVCAIKFVQKVVQVQTPGVIADPRVCRHCQFSG